MSFRLGCWRGRRRGSEGGESGPEEMAERLSQAHNGNGSQMRCRSAVTSASAGGRRPGVKGRRRPTKGALVTAGRVSAVRGIGRPHAAMLRSKASMRLVIVDLYVAHLTVPKTELK